MCWVVYRVTEALTQKLVKLNRISEDWTIEIWSCMVVPVIITSMFSLCFTERLKQKIFYGNMWYVISFLNSLQRVKRHIVCFWSYDVRDTTLHDWRCNESKTKIMSTTKYQKIYTSSCGIFIQALRKMIKAEMFRTQTAE